MFNMDKYLIIINKQKYVYLNSVMEKFLIYNEIKSNGFCNILNIHTNFIHNDIFKYILHNSTSFSSRCLMYMYLCQ